METEEEKILAWSLVAAAVEQNEIAFPAPAPDAPIVDAVSDSEDDVDVGLMPRAPKRARIAGPHRSSVAEEVEQYRKAHPPPRGVNGLAWWAANEPLYPRVARWARILLAIPASSAPSERVFSKVNIVVEKRTNRLLPRRAEQRVLLKHNMPVVDPAPAQ